MTLVEQAQEWVRNIRLARSHFDVVLKLDDAHEDILGVASVAAMFLALAYQAHRNSLIVHLAAATDRTKGAIKARTLLPSSKENDQLLQQVQNSPAAQKIELVRNKTIGHRSSSHSNKSAWAEARLTLSEIEAHLVSLEAIADGIGETYPGCREFVAHGAGEGAAEIVRHILNGRKGATPEDDGPRSRNT